MTNAIQLLINWRAEKLHREWTLRSTQDCVVIALREKFNAVDLAVNYLEIQQARVDTLVEKVNAMILQLESLLPVVHGETCRKFSHISGANPHGEGWLHAADYDGPYSLTGSGGPMYCGRCHEVL
jgi:hypothetical protein